MKNSFLTGACAVTIALVCLLSGGCQAGLDDKAAREFLEHWRFAYNSHDVVGFTALYAREGHFLVAPTLYPARTAEILRKTMDALWRRSHDLRITSLDEIVAGHDRIAFRWTMSFTGRHALDPSRLVGSTFMHIENGRITREVAVFRRVQPLLR